MRTVSDTHANMAYVHFHCRYEDWSHWRDCQYASDEHKALVDEVFAPIVQRYYDNYKYWHLEDLGLQS